MWDLCWDLFCAVALGLKTTFIVCGVCVGTLFCAVALCVNTIFIVCGVSVGTLFCAVVICLKSIFIVCVGLMFGPCFVLWILM